MEAYIIVQVIGILFILLAGIYAVFSSDADSRKRGYIISALILSALILFVISSLIKLWY
ncbi:MAG: hypothetical protein KHY45_11340 [Eubacterium sp.]|jgi:predicted acyltransferase|nr:hypothetical protein [Eubacterium sp.]